MRVAIMQPYIFPYIGYFQLINSVDTFIIYDNIQYSKKGWINRNRILVNGKDEYITIPLKKDSDYLNVVEREVSDVFEKDKLLRKLQESYRKAPEFKTAFPLIESIVNYNDNNLFNYIYNSVSNICQFLDIDTKFVISSTIAIDHSLKAQDKVIALCNTEGATVYINSIGGMELYSKEDFKKQNIALQFLKSNPILYKQFNEAFVPWLSIIDVMMFNSKSTIQTYLNEYTLV